MLCCKYVFFAVGWTSETRYIGGVLMLCSKTRGCVAVQVVCVFCYLVVFKVMRGITDTKRQERLKRPTRCLFVARVRSGPRH